MRPDLAMLWCLRVSVPLSLLFGASFPVLGADSDVPNHARGLATAHVDANQQPTRTSDEGHRYNISTSLWTTHFNPQPEHNNTQRFIGLERYGDNFVTAPLQERFIALDKSQPLLGLAHFSNSYAQSTWYAYAGFSRTLWQQGELQAGLKVTAGFIHGYRNEFQYKIPFNSYGTSPAAVPSLTLRYRQFNGEAILFGISGLMLNIGYSF